MELFAVFDPDNKGKVYALEVFTVLALFCTDSLEAKLRFIFSLFDFDKSDGISPEEMVMLMRCVTRGLCRIGLTETYPEYKQLEILSKTIFECCDKDQNGDVSVSEFVGWTTADGVASGLLTCFQNDPGAVLVEKDRVTSITKFAGTRPALKKKRLKPMHPLQLPKRLQ